MVLKQKKPLHQSLKPRSFPTEKKSFLVESAIIYLPFDRQFTLRLDSAWITLSSNSNGASGKAAYRDTLGALIMPFHPINASAACLRRSRRLLALSEQALPDPKVKSDLRRLALVMAVTAVDSYMHWLVYRQISEVRKQGDLPKSLAELDLPFTDIAALADATIRGRKDDSDTRPWVQVKNVMQKRLLKETFQSYDQVATAFSWAGVDKPWSRAAAKLGVQADDIKARLNSLVHRRNQIVHEGDITRASRPRQLKYNKVDHAQVVADVDWIAALIQTIEQVIVDGNPT